MITLEIAQPVVPLKFAESVRKFSKCFQRYPLDHETGRVWSSSDFNQVTIKNVRVKEEDLIEPEYTFDYELVFDKRDLPLGETKHCNEDGVFCTMHISLSDQDSEEMLTKKIDFMLDNRGFKFAIVKNEE